MNEKKNQTQSCSYGTGSTHPKKSRDGMLAVVLAVIILLGGLLSLMNVLNIQMFHEIKEAAPALTFSRQIDLESQADGIGNKPPRLGIRCETVSPFLQNYYRLPKGVYVTQVIPGSAAQKAGLMMGDVIVTFSGIKVENVSQLARELQLRQVGDPVLMTVVRGGNRYPVTVVLGEN